MMPSMPMTTSAWDFSSKYAVNGDSPFELKSSFDPD